MARASLPPVDDPVRAAPALPAQRGADHDHVVGTEVPAARRHDRRFRPVVDVAASLAALAVAARVGADVRVELLVAVALAWPLFLAANGWFTRRPLGEPVGTRAARVLRAGAGLGVTCWLATLVVGEAAAPRTVVPLVVALTVAVLVTGLMPWPGAATRVLLAGNPDDVRSAVTELATSRRVVVSAACVSAAPSSPLGALPVQVGISQAADLAGRSASDALIVLPGPGVSHAAIRRLEWDAAGVGIPLYVGTGLLDVSPARISVVQGGGLDVMQVHAAPSRGFRRLAKGLVERLLAAVALLALAPALVVVWALVRRDTGGPGLFRQRRIGRHGAEFTMLKFRTMSCRAVEEQAELEHLNQVDGGVLFKLRDDPRVTRLGQFLRRYSIDELPQLWNVVAGQMSLVGPRPALPQEVEQYDVDPRRRLAVKPGLTGLWQVSGRSDLSWAESVRLDVRYVDNWSLHLDLVIIAQTLRAVLGHRGAY